MLAVSGTREYFGSRTMETLSCARKGQTLCLKGTQDGSKQMSVAYSEPCRSGQLTGVFSCPLLMSVCPCFGLSVFEIHFLFYY